MKTGMEGDFDTGNMRFKARERYSFGVSDWRCCIWFTWGVKRTIETHKGGFHVALFYCIVRYP